MSAHVGTIHITKDLDLVAWLRKKTLPHDAPLQGAYLTGPTWWVVEPQPGVYAAYGGAQRLQGGVIDLPSYGVLPAYRGQGMQLALIRRHVAWGRRQGGTVASTYTSVSNITSMSNFWRAGFRPARHWNEDGNQFITVERKYERV